MRGGSGVAGKEAAPSVGATHREMTAADNWRCSGEVVDVVETLIAYICGFSPHQAGRVVIRHHQPRVNKCNSWTRALPRAWKRGSGGTRKLRVFVCVCACTEWGEGQQTVTLFISFSRQPVGYLWQCRLLTRFWTPSLVPAYS